ncbi:hypothetical protein TNCV_1073711 [Trichonephila clavipes]|uniref:Uncharacterized protein n=1 Tax=Trichonephila clavipes TaxID=2585209 RepID=A0A8X6SQA8_TRICX|nr:hypothetical protein TNCV_1073711 [Trichonephila clavipes]
MGGANSSKQDGQWIGRKRSEPDHRVIDRSLVPWSQYLITIKSERLTWCNVTSPKHQHLVGFFVDPTPTRASCSCNATTF